MARDGWEMVEGKVQEEGSSAIAGFPLWNGTEALPFSSAFINAALPAEELQPSSSIHHHHLLLIMRLQSLLVLLVAYISATAWAIFADEVDHVDFHHALLGIPSTHPHSASTFFHRPISFSSASLLYTLSEKLILGAVNPKDGSVVWRQNVSRSAGTDGAVGFLRASDQSRTIVSAVGEYVAAWNAFDGKLVWEKRFVGGGSVKDLELLELHDPTAETGTRDVVAVFGEEDASVVSTVRRLDGSTGQVQWEFRDSRHVTGLSAIF